MLTDYHVHLRPDEDDSTAERYFTAGNVERYREAAEERGIEELGVAEHIHRFVQSLDVWQHPWYRHWARDDIDEYCEFLRASGLKVGIEADFLPGREDRVQNLLEAREWDYVVGSVHFVDGIPVDQAPGLVDELEVGDAWRRYFAWLREAAASGLFDVLAHPDLVKIWGRRPSADETRHLHLEVADAVTEAGVCVEVSAAGLHKPVGELYPDAELLELCRERGVPITLASDAHRPAHVGRDVVRAAALARGVGYETVTVFDARERRQEPLG